MTDNLFPQTLRELRADLTRRPVIIGVLALGLILGISGPFDTLSMMPALPRVAYWITVVALTFSVGSLVSTLVHRALQNRSIWIRIAVSVSMIGLAVTATLSLLNLLAFGIWFSTWGEFFNQLGVVTLISGVIEVCSFALCKETGHESAKPAPVLNRLPLDKRGSLIALDAEDHYVRVTTIRGEDLVLMRLSDALTEAGDTHGLQIHRSHWIALDQIKKVTRNGDRGEVILSDGTSRPISRGYMPAVRAAGLLPKGRNA